MRCVIKSCELSDGGDGPANHPSVFFFFEFFFFYIATDRRLHEGIDRSSMASVIFLGTVLNLWL